MPKRALPEGKKAEKAPTEAKLANEKKQKKQKKKNTTKGKDVPKFNETQLGNAEEPVGDKQLKSEVADFLSSFNYETDSDISEPEGLDDIQDKDES
mmetsp:Transcript_21793/g.49299  ORF Transcript_21793/g.49299 Transcript_21793/m.49299 type:complete len:96 (+) Transcript_21793:190-477(+)|eukprot:CAMPEP_0172586726 /NCGR_PEP_ID=MMETSP1068-20121228/6016_1 /TAXON_ID=35684 /ORGANISM="Pseudopedinella elastica, Strain CCMP716" /LENGTH=95 /DNA_ID=CAMNT_0013381597 /DNA_START=186 /DNA_END=473 /DNA_ORIENTATION=+